MIRFSKVFASLLAVLLLNIALLTAPSAAAQRIAKANNVPAGTRQARDLGPVDSAREINITVQLKLQNQDAFDKVVDALYDPASPTFHHWLTDEQLNKYAPTKEQITAVRQELENHGLTILSTSKNGFSIRAHGTAGNVASAFNTHIHQFQGDGKVFRASVETARLSGAVGDYVAAVAGIESHDAHPLLSRAVNGTTHLPPPSVALSKVQTSGGLGAYITDQILSAPMTYTFNTAGVSISGGVCTPTPGAPYPIGVFSGNVYGANPALTPDYSPAQLEEIYGLRAAYNQGLDGSGQTIVLLEGYGYPTIEADANAFFSLTGLPLLTPANFSIVYPEGQPADPTAGELVGWDVEIALDVQWAHAIAPGAKIVVVAAAGQDSETFQDAISYITDHHLGNSVNDSWEDDTDIISGPDEEQAFDRVLQIAAARGISFQFSSGDGGDGGLGTPIGAPGVPSNSPHATAVGGTSILNKLTGSGFETLGWGTSFAELNLSGLVDPPSPFFYAGAGGGESIYFPKPFWQKGVPGTGRGVPDVSALADPYTGVPIVVTQGGVQYLETGWGGTSLASPIFTAIWAIANQKAGHPLGQAAPTLAALPGGLVDVLPLTSPTSVTGTIFTGTGSTYYSATNLFSGVLYDATGFTSAEVDYGGVEDLAISFGLDSSLTVTPGWDNVTGYGTPHGLAFINAVAK